VHVSLRCSSRLFRPRSRIRPHSLCARVCVYDSVNSNRFVYDSENRMPWNIIPEFGGHPPQKQPIAWHGPGRKSYNFLDDSIGNAVVC
jgi:hypothetical protein